MLKKFKLVAIGAIATGLVGAGTVTGVVVGINNNSKSVEKAPAFSGASVLTPGTSTASVTPSIAVKNATLPLKSENLKDSELRPWPFDSAYWNSGKNWDYYSLYSYQFSKDPASPNSVEWVKNNYADGVAYSTNLVYPLSFSDAYLPSVPEGYSWSKDAAFFVGQFSYERQSNPLPRNNEVVALSSGAKVTVSRMVDFTPPVMNGDLMRITRFLIGPNGLPTGRELNIHYTLANQSVSAPSFDRMTKGKTTVVDAKPFILAGINRFSLTKQLVELPEVDYGFYGWSGPEVYRSNVAASIDSQPVSSWEQLRAGDTVSFIYTSKAQSGRFIAPNVFKVNYQVENTDITNAELDAGLVSRKTRKTDNASYSSVEFLQGARDYFKAVEGLYLLDTGTVAFYDPLNQKVAALPSAGLMSGYKAVVSFNGAPTGFNTSPQPVTFQFSFANEPALLKGDQGLDRSVDNSREIHAGSALLNLDVRLVLGDKRVNYGYTGWSAPTTYQIFPDGTKKVLKSGVELVPGSVLVYEYSAIPDPAFDVKPYKFSVTYPVVPQVFTDGVFLSGSYSAQKELEVRTQTLQQLVYDSYLDLDRQVGDLYYFIDRIAKVTNADGTILTSSPPELQAGQKVEIVFYGNPTVFNKSKSNFNYSVVYTVVPHLVQGTDIVINSKHKFFADFEIYDWTKAPRDELPAVMWGYNDWTFSKSVYDHDADTAAITYAAYPKEDNNLEPYYATVFYTSKTSSFKEDDFRANKVNTIYVSDHFDTSLTVRQVIASMRQKLSDEIWGLYDFSLGELQGVEDQYGPTWHGDELLYLVMVPGRTVYIGFQAKPTSFNLRNEGTFFSYVVFSKYVQGTSETVIADNYLQPYWSAYDFNFIPYSPPRVLAGYYEWESPTITYFLQDGREVSSDYDYQGVAVALTYVARPFPSANLQPYYFKVRFNGRTSIDLIERDLEKRTSLILERNLASSAGLTLSEISAKAARQLNDEFWGMYYFNGSVLLVQKTDGSIVSPQNQSSYVSSPGDKVQIIYNSAATAFNKYKSVTRFTLVWTIT